MTTHTNTITHSHDKLFKTVFSKKEAVAEFIQKFLPSDVASRIDLDSLTLDSTEYIDEHLKDHCSDVVYNADYISNNQQTISIKVSLLFEHKSYQESHPHLQLLRYFLNVWEIQRKQKQPLTPFIPIIFYHGKKAWNNKPFHEYFDNLGDSNLLRFAPQFECLLVDTTQYNNKDFQQLNVGELQYSIAMMKYISDMDAFLDNLADIFANVEQFIATQEGGNFFQTMVIYLYQYSGLTADQWREKMQAINTLSPQLERTFISTYDQAINEGMKKGKEEGKKEALLKTAKNLKKIGISTKIISESTGLSLTEIDKL